MLRQPDLDKPYRDQCRREEESQELFYNAKQDLLHSLANNHQACFELIEYMDCAEDVLASLIGIIVRVARDKEKTGVGVTEMGYLLMNAVLHPHIEYLAELRVED